MRWRRAPRTDKTLPLLAADLVLVVIAASAGGE
jgi:hypothetical protein